MKYFSTIILIFTFIINLFPKVLFSQGDSFGFGFDYSNKYQTTIKFTYDRIKYEKRDNAQIIGFEYNQSIFNWTAQNMTGYFVPSDGHSLNKTRSSLSAVALKYGHEISTGIFLSAFLGLNYSKEFDKYVQRYSEDIFYLDSGNGLISPYLKIGIEIYSSKISPKIGFGTNGFSVGISITPYNVIKHFSDKRKKKKSKDLKLGDNLIFDINLYDMRDMVEVFIDDCIKNNIIKEKNSIKITFESLSGYIIAIAEGMFEDGEIIVKVDPKKWELASPSKKWYVLYHELGHDYLNLEHGEGGKMMFPFIDRDYSWEEFYEDKNYMFESYLKSIK